MTRRTRQAAFVIGALVAIGAGAFAFHRFAPTQRASVAATATSTGAESAADLFYRQRLRDASNAELDMGRFRGRLVVVNFWATWCAPCVEEIPSFSKVHADVREQVAFVGLGIDSIGNVIGFAERFKPSYPLVAAGGPGTDLARAFGDDQGGLPYTVLLGPDGRVLERRLGRLDEPTLRGWIARHTRPASG